MLDAVLHEPPPQRTQHTIWRPRVVGQRLPALDQVLQDPQTHWQQLTLEWYGEGEQTLEICTGTALCYRYGSDPLPIRWVLTHDPLGKRPPKAIFSTASTQTAEQIISHFMKRWSWEVTFEESRALMAHRDAAPMVRPGHRTHDTFALWPFQPCGTRMARALHPDGHISVARVGLVS